MSRQDCVHLGWEGLWLMQLALLILTNPQGVSDLLSSPQTKKPQLVLCVSIHESAFDQHGFSERHG